MRKKTKVTLYWFEQPCEQSRLPVLRRATGKVTGEWFKHRNGQVASKDAFPTKLEAIAAQRTKVEAGLQEIFGDIDSFTEVLTDKIAEGQRQALFLVDLVREEYKAHRDRMMLRRVKR